MGIRRTEFSKRKNAPVDPVELETQPEHETFAIRRYVIEMCERGRCTLPSWLRPEISEWLHSLTSEQLLSFNDQICKYGLPLRHIMSGKKTIYGTAGCGVAPWYLSPDVYNPTSLTRKGAQFVRADTLPEDDITHNGQRYVRVDEQPQPQQQWQQAPQYPQAQQVVIHHHHYYGEQPRHGHGPVIDHDNGYASLPQPNPGYVDDYTGPMPVLPIRLGNTDYHPIGEDGRPFTGKGQVARIERRPADFLKPAFLDGDPYDPASWSFMGR